jgi:hypothetical protein
MYSLQLKTIMFKIMHVHYVEKFGKLGGFLYGGHFPHYYLV